MIEGLCFDCVRASRASCGYEYWFGFKGGCKGFIKRVPVEPPVTSREYRVERDERGALERALERLEAKNGQG